MIELRNYLFVDQAALDQYLEQISSLETEDHSKSTKLGVSLTGPQAERTTSVRYRLKTTDEKIREIKAFLKKQKMLGFKRPITTYGDVRPPPFIIENIVARKIILPTKSLEVIPGVKHLAVWIADPDPKI